MEALVVIIIIGVVYLSIGFGAIKSTEELLGRKVTVLRYTIILNWAQYIWHITKLSKLNITDLAIIKAFANIFEEQGIDAVTEASYFAKEALSTLRGEQ